MKVKRSRQERGDTRSDELGEQLVRNQQTEGAARSIYVVVNIWDARPVHSFYKVDYPYPTEKNPRRRLLPVATLEIEGGKAFVSLRTRRRKWIVAVGGRQSTVVFDAETEEVIHGPSLLNEKERPVVVAVGDKIYALSSSPRVKGNRDFEPWFEVLDLSAARVVDGCLVDCSWKELPSPPCFPCQLTALEFFHPPMVTVQSYAVVGSYLLLSLRSNQQATYAFDTISAKWHKVHDSESLPFIGRPTPQQQQQQQHGGALYLGESAQGNDRWSSVALQRDPAVISAYTIKLSSCKKEDDDSIKLSITEFPVRSSETCNAVTGTHYSSLDKGIFCSLDWKSRKRGTHSWDDDILADEVHYSKKATMTFRTYQIEDNSLLQEETLAAKKIAISEQPEQAFKIHAISGGIVSPAFLTAFNT
uniref:Uncharacterized protein n=1 Tax=Avena sativa TaxID=4498 RepID=A0ACD6A1N1_AVESA